MSSATITVKRNGTVVKNGEIAGKIERRVVGEPGKRNWVVWYASTAQGKDLGRFYAKKLAVHAIQLMSK